MGTEVKSLRDGQASLADAFATVDDGEIWLRNLHIPEYHHGSWTNHAPRRNRKLLLHRSQIDNADRQDPRRQPDAGAAVAVLLRRQGQGRTRAGPRQAGARQAPGHGQARRRPRGHPRTGPAHQGHDLIGRRLRAGCPALGYGVSDFVGGIASRRVAALRVVLVSYPVALVLLTGARARRRRATSRRPRWCGARCAESARRSACGGSTPRSGSGPISVVSPLTAILVAGVPVGVGVALGERPACDRVRRASSLALVAVVLVSREATRRGASTPAPLHHEGRLADGGRGRGLRVELRADRPGAGRGASCGRWCSRGLAASLLVVGIAAVSAQPRRAERAYRCSWRCWPAVLDTVANVAMLLALQASMLSLAECADLVVSGGHGGAGDGGAQGAGDPLAGRRNGAGAGGGRDDRGGLSTAG